MYIERNPDLTQKARELRKNMTPWERKLWYDFLRTYPVRFQRQKPIDNYIVDFYCASHKLVTELDGGQHYEESGIMYDQRRTQTLEGLGVWVLRFSNWDVDTNFQGVCRAVVSELENSHGEESL